MRIFEEMADERRIKKFGYLAHKLRTSYMLLTGRRGEGGIRIEDLLIESNGNFRRYQEIIRKNLSGYYEVDFLDFSLMMGKFFGVYNMYCYKDISRDIRRRIINDSNINRNNTKELLELRCAEIYDYFCSKYQISMKDFFTIMSNLFVVSDDYSLYNNPLVTDLFYMLIGNYLFLEDNNLCGGFIGCKKSIDYFEKTNNELNKKRVI